jgi:hypothetical protein
MPESLAIAASIWRASSVSRKLVARFFCIPYYAMRSASECQGPVLASAGVFTRLPPSPPSLTLRKRARAPDKPPMRHGWHSGGCARRALTSIPTLG